MVLNSSTQEISPSPISHPIPETAPLPDANASVSNIVMPAQTSSYIIEGCTKLAEVVGSTLGPGGRTVLLENLMPHGQPRITKDGVTVARYTRLSDPYEEMAAAILREAALKANTTSGDGTTTATILGAALVKAILQPGTGIGASAWPKLLNSYKERIITALRNYSTELCNEPREQLATLKQICAISTNADKELSDLIAEGWAQIGAKGVFSVSEAPFEAGLNLEVTTGIKVKGTVASSVFFTSPKGDMAQYHDAYVLLYKESLGNFNAILPLLEKLSGNPKPLVIIAGGFQPQLLHGLEVNKTRGWNIAAAVLFEPDDGTWEDLTVSTGATLFSDLGDSDLEEIELTDLGTVANIMIGRENIMFEPSDEALAREHIESLRFLAEGTPEEAGEFLARAANLEGKVAHLRVGGLTEVERLERLDRADDAVRACGTVFKGGWLPGAQTALYRVSKELMEEQDEEGLGFASDFLVGRALQQPWYALLYNLYPENQPKYVDLDAIQGGNGYDLNPGSSTFEQVVNLKEAGIIDPTLVVIGAVEAAFSVAAALINCNHMVRFPEGIDRFLIGRSGALAPMPAHIAAKKVQPSMPG